MADAKTYTKYERARLIGARALQLSMGAPIQVKLSKKKLEELNYNPVEIAKLELAKDVIPLEVVNKVMTESEKEAEEVSKTKK